MNKKDRLVVKKVKRIMRSKRGDILAEAQKIITGERREAYGPVNQSFRRVALVWNGILLPKLAEELTDEDVALMMIGLKVMREANRPKRDNLVDIIGYTLLRNALRNNKKANPRPGRR